MKLANRAFTRHIKTGALVVLAAVSLSACTFVPTDGQPQPVNPKNVPFNLLGPHQGPNQR